MEAMLLVGTVIYYSPHQVMPIEPCLRFEKGGSEGPRMIGRERTGILSVSHMRAFRPSVSESGDWD